MSINEEFAIEVIYNTKTDISISYLDNIISFTIPRNQIKLLSVDSYEDIDNYGIYFLVDRKSQNLYIGKTDNLLKRIIEHSKSFEKDFDYIYTFTTKSNLISQTYIDYLEHHFINKLSKSNYWSLYNKDLRIKTPNLKPIERVNLNKLISNIDCLLSFLRINLKEKEITTSDDVFKYKGVKIIYSSQGLFMLKDSIILGYSKVEKIKVEQKHQRWLDSVIKRRKFLIENWLENNWIKKIENNNDEYILLKDIEVNSPSEAAKFVSGGTSASGWSSFKNKNGKTLEEVFR
ncbi:MAG: DUF4357 domain-containing protein [Mycoplasmoidaceae bacterium]